MADPTQFVRLYSSRNGWADAELGIARELNAGYRVAHMVALGRDRGARRVSGCDV
jgi:hypothetical protein